MALWTLPMGVSTWAVPQDASGPVSTSVVASSTAHTKGAWTEMVASTSDRVSGFFVMLPLGAATSATDTSSLLDVAVGAAGAEVVVFADLSLGAHASDFFYIPISLPASARITARIQSAVTSKSVELVVAPCYGAPVSGALNYGRAVTYGADTAASRGQSITPGANSEGSWVEIVAATTSPSHALMMSLSGSAAMAALDYSFDIGVGGAGAESVLIPDLPAMAVSTSEILRTMPTPPIAVSVPEGARLSIRGRSSSATTPLYAHLHAFS